MEVGGTNPDDPTVADLDGNLRLGENLRGARKALKLTQEQVAERSGVHPTEVSRIESGKRDPHLSTIRKLARAVEVEPAALLNGVR
jgi:transcriptional regulator with XRE-family HTH domain